MKIVTVIPLEKSTFSSDLTYFSAKEVDTGSIVSVPLRNKKVLGLVIESKDVGDEKSNIKELSYKLKKVSDIKGKTIFRKEFLDSIFLFATYEATSPNNTISNLIPALFREKYDDLAKLCKEPKNEESQNIKSEKLLLQAPLEDRLSFYKTLIRGYFAIKKSAFVILPTPHDIEQMKDQLSKGIEKFTFVMHSGMKPKEILENFSKIMSSSHSILILATPQYLSIPRPDIGAIVVEHESSKAYKSVQKPNLDFRVFAEIYAAKIGAKFILSDTILRFDTIARKELDSLNEVYPLSFRIQTNDIQMSIMNPNEQEEDKYFLPIEQREVKEFKLFSPETLEKIKTVLEKNKNVVIFSLRKGLATYTVCRDCTSVLSCEECLAPVVLYVSSSGKRMFICNKCSSEKDPETTCKKCGSWNLQPLGIGTETVVEELKKEFPKQKILKLDKSSIKSASGAKKIVDDFEGKSKGSILIGTEMIFYYLKEKVDLSIISSFDSLWSIPNYKMGERILGILLSMIDITKKELIVQTKNKHDPALLYMKSENLLPFVREELKDRENLNYPPYKRFIKITHEGDKEETRQAREDLKELFKEYDIDIFSGFVQKKKDKYITNGLIKLDRRKWSLSELSIGGKIDSKLSALLERLPNDYTVSVDPEDLL